MGSPETCPTCGMPPSAGRHANFTYCDNPCHATPPARDDAVEKALRACMRLMETMRFAIHMHREGMTVPGEPRMDHGCADLDRDGSMAQSLLDAERKARAALRGKGGA